MKPCKARCPNCKQGECCIDKAHKQHLCGLCRNNWLWYTRITYSPVTRTLNGKYMPRHDWNRPQAHTQTPHHRRMKSGAKGKGHDHYIRAAKQRVSQSKADTWKADLRRRAKEREERNGTVGDTTLQEHHPR